MKLGPGDEERGVSYNAQKFACARQIVIRHPDHFRDGRGPGWEQSRRQSGATGW